MCKRGSPHKNLSEHGMFKINSLNKNEANKRVKEICPRLKKRKKKRKRKKASTGCVRETPHRKVNPTWDV